jgi:hypothetical protein
MLVPYLKCFSDRLMGVTTPFVLRAPIPLDETIPILNGKFLRHLLDLLILIFSADCIIKIIKKSNLSSLSFYVQFPSLRDLALMEDLNRKFLVIVC